MRDNYKDAYNFRLQDAHALHDKRRFEGAFYVGGYVVECVVKYAHVELLGSRYGGSHKANEIYVEMLENDKFTRGTLKFLVDDNKLPNDLVRDSLFIDWTTKIRYQGKLRNLCNKHYSEEEYCVAMEELSKQFLDEIENICLTIRTAITESKRGKRR